MWWAWLRDAMTARLATFRCKQPEEIGLLVALVRQLCACGNGLLEVTEPTGTYGDALRKDERFV